MKLNKIIQGDALLELKKLPSDLVDTIITSPPYWGLRDYGEETKIIWGGKKNCKHKWEGEKFKQHSGRGDAQKSGKYSEQESIPDKVLERSFCQKCGAWYGQLGLEPTLDLFIEHLLKITQELKRVLKPTGVMYWNHGDCYGGSWQNYGNRPEESGISLGQREKKTKYFERKGSVKTFPPTTHLKPKCLVLQNYRLIIQMINQGWILRNTIVWWKPNHMPSSVKDRFTNAYEPVFMLVKKKKYWFDLDAVRKPYTSPINRWGGEKVKSYKGKFDGFKKESEKYNSPRARSQRKPQGTSFEGRERDLRPNKAGKNPGDVWKPYAVQERTKEWIEYRNLPEIKEIQDYLNKWRKKKGLTIEKVEEILQSQAPHHWFNGESYPTKEDWIEIKKLLGFDDEYDELMVKTYIKSAEKQDSPKGKNPGDLWKISTQPFPEAHFATFPEKLIEPMILSSCPKWICKKCGKARIRIVKRGNKEPDENYKGQSQKEYRNAKAQDPSESKRRILKSIANPPQTIGWTKCSCENPEYEAGIVLDPFFGSGTVGVVAKRHMRNYLGIELNKSYIEIAKKRIRKQHQPLL